MKKLQLQIITAWDLDLRNVHWSFSTARWAVNRDMQTEVKQGIVEEMLEVMACPVSFRVTCLHIHFGNGYMDKLHPRSGA